MKTDKIYDSDLRIILGKGTIQWGSDSANLSGQYSATASSGKLHNNGCHGKAEKQLQYPKRIFHNHKLFYMQWETH